MAAEILYNLFKESSLCMNVCDYVQVQCEWNKEDEVRQIRHLLFVPYVYTCFVS